MRKHTLPIVLFLAMVAALGWGIYQYNEKNDDSPRLTLPHERGISQNNEKNENNENNEKNDYHTYTSSSSGVSRSDDIHLLARTIHAESKGEPYLGQVAVGAVMLNRIKHPSFPNTLAGVVYQPCAFEPVKNGAINEAPSDSAYNAARDVLNGWDPTAGAIYFWNPSTATSKWIWTRRITLTIGKHVFAHD